MEYRRFITILILLIPILFGCSKEQGGSDIGGKEPKEIAIISDPHIMDVIGHPELVKSMEEEVLSTRLFNENIFAFRAALDDAARRGIKIVVFPGDMTDDGQIINQESVTAILKDYERNYGILFFMTPGNHDPKVPFGQAISYNCFLKDDGSTCTIDSDTFPGLWSAGHEQQVECYADFGYYPRNEYLYWEMPFSSYDVDSYSYTKALEESASAKRYYSLSDSEHIFDTSYLVEPSEGIWLLSIDSGVYPSDGKGGYKNSGEGYNNTLTYKPYLIPWIKKVCREAEKRNKTLVAFSHFPLLDFNNGATEIIARLWGKDKFDISRIPSEAISDSLLLAGVKLHFGGHMHINNTSSKSIGGKTLTNIQVPSIAAAVPAYKVMTVKGKDDYFVEDVILDDVPGFDSLFGLYQKEWDHTISIGKQPIWNLGILKSRDYAEFCDRQLQDLTHQRFCIRDVPVILQEGFVSRSGAELLEHFGCENVPDGMEKWTGYNIILDIYRFHYSGPLAWKLVSKTQLQQYEQLFDAAENSTKDPEMAAQVCGLEEMLHCFIEQ